MTTSEFPTLVRSLPRFDGPFDAFRLAADGCDVLFASYPAGTVIAEHDHPTENVGVVTSGELILIQDGLETRVAAGEWYHLDPHQRHSARFERPTQEIEFWFTHP